MKIFFVLLTVILVIGLITGIYSNSEKKTLDEFGRIIEDSNIDTGVDDVTSGTVDEDVVYERPEGRPYDPLREPTATVTVENVRMKYQPILTKTVKGPSIRLTHETPSVPHHDVCDFKGDSTKDRTFITDVDLTIEVGEELDKEIASRTNASVMENGKYIQSPGFFEKVTIGKKTGYKLTEGVEGCGRYTYFIRLNPKISLIVVQQFVPELIGVTVEDYSTTPGIIQLDESEIFVKQIISSATVLEPQTD